jgi:hypothetical protein
LEKHVLSLRGEPFRLDHNWANTMEDAFYNRWRMVRTYLHYAGALLNPYLLHNKELADDSDSLIACKRVLQKLCLLETYPDVVQDFFKQGPFHEMLDPKDQKCSTYDWWVFESAFGKLIVPIARQILGQTVSSSSYEHNCSSYLFVHNKSQNKLQPKRAKDLVYIYTNLRLLAEGKEKDKKKWYADNVDVEDWDSALEEDVKDHGDLDSDGWDDGNLRI